MVEKDIMREVVKLRGELEAQILKLKEEVAYLTLENDRLSNELARYNTNPIRFRAQTLVMN